MPGRPRLRNFTVVWLAYGNPCITRIVLGPAEHEDGFNHDTWLAAALVTERGMSWEKAYAHIEDTAPSLCAVIKGHNNLVWKP